MATLDEERRVTPHIEGWTLVVIGFWNRMIFTPEWLQEAGILPAGQAVAVEIPANLIGPPRLSFSGINLRVDAQKLVIGADAPSDDRLGQMHQLVTTVLDRLPHTPVRAVGVNFQWLETDPPAPVLKCFEAADSDRLADENLAIQSAAIKRTLNDQGRMLNLSLQLTEQQDVLFDFNFHFPVTSATAARHAIDGGLVQLRDRALQILNSVYQLEPVAQ